MSNSEGVYFDLDGGIQTLIHGLDAKQAGIEKAIGRAIAKLTKWVNRQLLKMIADQSGVKQKSIKPRIIAVVDRDKKTGHIWIGLNPMPVHLAGRVSWNKNAAGAKAGGNRYEGAFYRAVYGSKRKVYIRSARNATEHHLTATKSGAASAIDDGRFPVEVVALELERVGRESIKRLERRAVNRLNDILAQEINYVINHE